MTEPAEPAVWDALQAASAMRATSAAGRRNGWFTFRPRAETATVRDRRELAFVRARRPIKDRTDVPWATPSPADPRRRASSCLDTQSWVHQLCDPRHTPSTRALLSIS